MATPVNLPPPGDERVTKLEADVRNLRRQIVAAEKRRIEAGAAVERRVSALENQPWRKLLEPRVLIPLLVTAGLLSAELGTKLLALWP